MEKERIKSKNHIGKFISKLCEVSVVISQMQWPRPSCFDGGNGNFYILGHAKGNKNFEGQFN